MGRKIEKIVGGFSQIGMCLGCLKGRLVKRGGKYGFFWGCSRFPNCSFTQQMTDLEMKELNKRLRKF